MQPLIITDPEILPYKIPFSQPFIMAGQSIIERRGFYLTIKTSNGLKVQAEAAPLPGISQETDRRTKHDLEEICAYFKTLQVPADRDVLVAMLRQEPHLLNACPSARFAAESVLLMVAALAQHQTLAEFLGGTLRDIPTAMLLQGAHSQVMADVKKAAEQGYQVFKLKVGDRNMALDIKKVQDVRFWLGKDGALRLDANRQWTLKEACIFAELAGLEKIDFMEEPLKDMSQLGEFYQATHMPLALDETLPFLRCGVQAPGRCSPTLSNHEAVKAYVLKPTLLGLIPALDWIQEARQLGKKAIISSAFESTIGLKILANLACLTPDAAGLGTERWLKGSQILVDEKGIIKKESLML